MKLFSRWKKRNIETLSQNNKPIIIRNTKHSLFDNIIGFDDVKSLFEMAIKAERPVILLLCGPPASGKSLFMSSLNNLGRSY
jgi:predicted ATPase with chaperone activity